METADARGRGVGRETDEGALTRCGILQHDATQADECAVSAKCAFQRVAVCCMETADARGRGVGRETDEGALTRCGILQHDATQADECAVRGCLLEGGFVVQPDVMLRERLLVHLII